MIKCATTFFLAFLIILCTLASAKINTKICRKKNGLFPKPGSLCKAYYKCSNFVPSEFLCPPEHHFSTTKLRCDWMHLFPCLEKPKSKECPTADGKFLKPGTGCIYFYDCCNGEPTQKKCPQGHLFDPSKGRCELKERYTCIESISTEGPKTSDLITTSRITESTHEVKIPSTNSITESTPEEIVYSTTSIRDSTPEEIVYSTTSIRDSTPEEIVYSTTSIRDSTPEEIVYSTTSIRDSTLEEIVYSTTSIRDSTSEEIVYSTALIRESTSEEVPSTTEVINESTSEQVVYSTTSIRESTPDERAFSPTETNESTQEEKTYSTTIRETTPEEIGESTTLTGETPFEESTTASTETDKRTTILDVSLSTENGQITNEPNIMCPEPFGYFPHPTDKHKFVGCVDNIPTVLTCPSDLIYNDEFKQCIYQ